MYRYTNTQTVRVRIPDAGNVEADPGEEFDSEQLLNNISLVPADDATRAAHAERDAAEAAAASGGDAVSEQVADASQDATALPGVAAPAKRLKIVDAVTPAEGQGDDVVPSEPVAGATDGAPAPEQS